MYAKYIHIARPNDTLRLYINASSQCHLRTLSDLESFNPSCIKGFKISLASSSQIMFTGINPDNRYRIVKTDMRDS